MTIIDKYLHTYMHTYVHAYISYGVLTNNSYYTQHTCIQCTLCSVVFSRSDVNRNTTTIVHYYSII